MERSNLLYECPECNKRIKTKYNLDKHYNAVHNKDENDAKYCTICGQLKSFDEYYKTKYGTYMSRCKMCNKEYGTEQIKCHLCKKSMLKKNIKRHIKNKHKNGVI